MSDRDLGYDILDERITIQWKTDAQLVIRSMRRAYFDPTTLEFGEPFFARRSGMRESVLLESSADPDGQGALRKLYPQSDIWKTRREKK